MRICNIQIKIYGLKMLITFERIFLGQIFLSRGFGWPIRTYEGVFEWRGESSGMLQLNEINDISPFAHSFFHNKRLYWYIKLLSRAILKQMNNHKESCH